MSRNKKKKKYQQNLEMSNICME